MGGWALQRWLPVGRARTLGELFGSLLVVGSGERDRRLHLMVDGWRWGFRWLCVDRWR